MHLAPRLAFALFYSFCATAGTAVGYEPLLPKPGPEPSEIIALDYHWETEHGAGKDLAIQAAAAAIQGVVNRSQSSKIYIKHQPVRVVGDGLTQQCVTNLRADAPKEHSTSDAVLSLLPVACRQIDLSTETRPDGTPYTKLQSPLLSYLLDHYGESLSGKVALYSNDGWWDKSTAGMRGAAITVAAFEDALLLNPRWLDYVRRHHPDVFARSGGQPKIIDLTGFKPDTPGDQSANVAAMKWMIDRYVHNILPGVNDDVDTSAYNKLRCRSVVFIAPSGSNKPCYIDYAVASRALSYYMEFPPDYEQAPHHDDLGLLFNEENYPLGIPQWGEVEVTHLNIAAAHYGYTAMHGQIPNCSATAAFPSDPDLFKPGRPGKTLPLEPNVVYISGNGPDGDALDFFLYGGFRSLFYDAQAGAVPNGWRVNPIFIDINPHLWAWLANTYPETVELLTSMNDGGLPPTESGRQAWADIYRNYHRGANGSFVGCNILAPWSMHADPFHLLLRDLALETVVMEYQGSREQLENRADILNGTLYIDQVSPRGDPKEFLPDSPAVAEDIAQFKKAILTRAKPGEPYFLFVRYPGETGQNFPSVLTRVRRELTEDPDIQAAGREVRFLLPRDFSATYRAWKAQTEGTDTR